jgi:hypothetical protein
MTITTGTTTLFPFAAPVSAKPVLRCYRHIVGEQVWSKVVEFRGWKKPTLAAAFKYCDYEPGSAFEGNLVHWIANRKKE